MNGQQLGGLTIVLLLLTAGAANAQMRITEWMYSGFGGLNEFVEFTNVGGSSIDMTGWNFDDNSRTIGSQSLSGFGTVAAGESVILAEDTAANFRTAWGLPGSVKVVGSNTNNLGRADEINLYDTTTLIDRLTYDDQALGGPRTQFRSGNPSTFAAVGANTHSMWVLATNGDSYGSHIAIAPSTGDIGNPGVFNVVPEPGSLVLLTLGAVLGCLRRRRQ